jgi:molecular chaperone HtpG
MTKKNKFEFQTDVRQILELVTHSLYSHRDIFLRELISNASDAIDKVRFESLTNKDLLENNADWKIKIIADKNKNTLTISDNGCGMNKDELINHLGCIAKSGTLEFLEKVKKNKENQFDLIGQFGVGFYSSFMVADLVVVQTRKAGENGYEWSSDGKGGFELEEFEKSTRGTDIILHLKEDAKEFLEEWTIKQTVKKYSNFVEFPILMDVEKSEYPEKDGKPDYDAKPIVSIEEETLNSKQAIWLKQKSEVKKEEYDQFYQHISHDLKEPLETIHYRAEGNIEFKALMYIPSIAPQNLFTEQAVKGLHLYINRVFIMDDCKKLIPEYLRFVKGVVDSSDLPLNVSREILQDNPKLEQIKKGLVQKILSTLKKMKDKDIEKYQKFYQEFGAVLKEGLHYDFSNKDKIMDLLLFETDQLEANQRKSLKQYVETMPKDQKEIYYVTAANRAKALSAPQIELLKSKNFEVLLLTDPVDDWITPHFNEYEKKPFKSINQQNLDIEEDKDQKKSIEEKSKTYEKLLSSIKENLKNEITEASFTSKLTDSVACLTPKDGGVTPQMIQMFKAMGQEIPKQEMILELNPNHPLIEVLNQLNESKSDQFNQYIDLIYQQASLTYGHELKNPLEFTKAITNLMVKAA